MEAKDTVMGRIQINKEWKNMGIGDFIPSFANYGEDHPTYKLLLAQAEISFRAGQKEESTQAYHAGLNDGILRGRKESGK